MVAHNLANILLSYTKHTGGLVLLSPVDIIFSEFDVVQPDVVFFKSERRPLIDLERPIRVVPDLAVEVLSRSTAARDRGRKIELFGRYCVPEYWIVDPVARTIEVFTNAGGTVGRAAAFDETDIVRAAGMLKASAP